MMLQIQEMFSSWYLPLFFKFIVFTKCYWSNNRTGSFRDSRLLGLLADVYPACLQYRWWEGAGLLLWLPNAATQRRDQPALPMPSPPHATRMEMTPGPPLSEVGSIPVRQLFPEVHMYRRLGFLYWWRKHSLRRTAREARGSSKSWPSSITPNIEPGIFSIELGFKQLSTKVVKTNCALIPNWFEFLC